MALSERDLKRIVAYASISHLGFIALGIFSLTTNGLNGAVIQIVNHGIIISALFLIVGFVEARTGTRDLGELSGLERRMPWLYFFFLVATLAESRHAGHEQLRRRVRDHARRLPAQLDLRGARRRAA